MRRRDFLGYGAASFLIFSKGLAAQPRATVQPRIPLDLRRPELIRLRVRPEIHSLTPPQLASFRRAVEVMKSRLVSDPTSWLFQRGVHASEGATPEVPGAVQTAFWNKCEHWSPHFLTWHRFYLYHVERMMRDASGDPGFVLPYWDYVRHPFLPPAFRNAIVGRQPNPLFHAARDPGLNDGTFQIPVGPDDINYDCLDGATLLDFSSMSEGNPHGGVHGYVGGDMGYVTRSPRDPIFYLHHCNIDRLWHRWKSVAGHVNPTNATWLGASWTFKDTAGEATNVVSSGLTTAQLGYTYSRPEMINVRFPIERYPLPRPIILPRAPGLAGRPGVLEFQGFEVRGPAASIALPIAPAESRVIQSTSVGDRSAGAGNLDVVLRNVNIVPIGNSGGVFDVFLVPANWDPTRFPPRSFKIGSFSTFELSVAQQHAQHGGDGAIRLRAAPALRQLQSQRALNPAQLQLLILRRGLRDRAGREQRPARDQVVARIGRLSVELPQR